MRKYLVVPVLCVVAFLGFGCGGGSTGPGETVAVETAEPLVDDAVEAEVEQILDVVVVEATGSEFEPAVQPEQIPEGAWYCDMGTVHYASLEHGEGKCAICGMNLVQKTVQDQG